MDKHSSLSQGDQQLGQLIQQYHNACQTEDWQALYRIAQEMAGLSDTMLNDSLRGVAPNEWYTYITHFGAGLPQYKEASERVLKANRDRYELASAAHGWSEMTVSEFEKHPKLVRFKRSFIPEYINAKKRQMADSGNTNALMGLLSEDKGVWGEAMRGDPDNAMAITDGLIQWGMAENDSIYQEMLRLQSIIEHSFFLWDKDLQEKWQQFVEGDAEFEEWLNQLHQAVTQTFPGDNPANLNTLMGENFHPRQLFQRQDTAPETFPPEWTANTASWNEQGEWSWPQPTRPVEEIPPVCPYCTLNGTTGETGCTCGYLRQLELQKAKQGKTADYQDGKVMYHLAPSRRRQKILEEGLRPDADQTMPTGHTPGVYLWDSPETAHRYKSQGLGDSDLWAVRMNDMLPINKDWHVDNLADLDGMADMPEVAEARMQKFPGAHYVTYPIPPENLRLHTPDPWKDPWMMSEQAQKLFDIQDQRDTTAKTAGNTRAWYLQRAAEIPHEDQSRIVHQFPDGWSIRQLQHPGDMAREGVLMNNCWKNHWVKQDERGYDTDEVDWNHPDIVQGGSGPGDAYSLRDPDNLPHVSFLYDRGRVGDPLGRHNSIARPEHLQRIGEAMGQTVEPAEIGIPTVGGTTARTAMAQPLSDLRARELTGHIEELAEQYGIGVSWTDNGQAGAWMHDIYTPIIYTDYDYLVGLHEIGHIAAFQADRGDTKGLGLEGQDWQWRTEHEPQLSTRERDIEDEAWIWRWASMQSRIPVTPDMWNDAVRDAETYLNVEPDDEENLGEPWYTPEEVPNYPRTGPAWEWLQQQKPKESRTAMDWMGDSYPGEDHTEEKTIDKDWTQLQFTEDPKTKVEEHNWIMSGGYVKISDEDFESLMALMGHKDDWKPLAYGTVEAYYNYEMMFHLQKSNIATHLVEKGLKKYCTDHQLKYEGILSSDGTFWEDQAKEASWEGWPEDDEMQDAIMRGMQPDPVPQAQQFATDDLLELMQEASQAARQRGHELIWDKTQTERYRDGRCVNCGADVQVIADPRANEIDMAGPALAAECTGKWSKRRLAEVPGVGRENPEKLWRMHMIDTQPVDYYGEQDPKIDNEPQGEMICPHCGEICDSYGDFLVHEERAHHDGLGIPDSPQPVVDMDDPLPAHFNTSPDTRTDMTVNRQAAYSEHFQPGDLVRIKGSDYPTDQDIEVVEHRGTQVLVLMGSHREPGSHQSPLWVDENLLEPMTEPPASFSADLWPDTLPWGEEGNEYYRQASWGEDLNWRTYISAKMPLIPGPIPFIFDIEADKIHSGQPGHKHKDIKPKDKLTVNVVEGLYLPDGKLQFRTDSTMPYTVRYVIRMWYTLYPELEVKQVFKLVGDKKFKLANAKNIGGKVRDVAFTDQAAREAYSVLSNYGDLYVVGGAVRDICLGHLPKDIDLLVAGLTPDQISTLLNSLPGQTKIVGEDFPVFEYQAQDGSKVEIALPRTEVSTGEGHKEFDVQADPFLPIETDLARRDFTCNAQAVNMRTGEHIDPFNGQHDLSQHELKEVSPLKHDPLRILRAFALISGQGLKPDEEVKKAIEENAYKLRAVPPQKIYMQLDKIFGGRDPESAVRAMRDLGVLHYVMPEVAATIEFDQKNKNHKKTLDEHSLEVLRKVAEESDDPDLRLTSLYHDVGKVHSQWLDEDGNGHYYKKIHNDELTGKPTGEESGAHHEEVGAQMAHDFMTRNRYPDERRDRVVHLIRNHMFHAFEDIKGARKFVDKVSPEHAHDLLTLRNADQEGKGTADEWGSKVPVSLQRQMVQNVLDNEYGENPGMSQGRRPDQIGLANLAVNGKDLIAEGIPATSEMGRILHKLWEAVMDDPSLNNKAFLLEMARNFHQMKDASVHKAEDDRPIDERLRERAMQMQINKDMAYLNPHTPKPFEEGDRVNIPTDSTFPRVQEHGGKQGIVNNVEYLQTYRPPGQEFQPDKYPTQRWTPGGMEEIDPDETAQKEHWDKLHDWRVHVQFPDGSNGQFWPYELQGEMPGAPPEDWLRQSSILDPIRDALDEAVFEHADADMPRLKPKIRHWIKRTIYKVLRDNNYPDPEEWTHLVLTGSLTTYQWSPSSDLDVALFLTHPIPDWRRAELISLLLKHIEDVPVPGTTHRLGIYIEPVERKPSDIFRPGLRSAFDIDNDRWIVLPERERTIDIQKEMGNLLTYAKTVAAKMKTLILYDPPGAKTYWHQIMERWRRDQTAGKGDYHESNIVYKYLMKHHLSPFLTRNRKSAIIANDPGSASGRPPVSGTGYGGSNPSPGAMHDKMNVKLGMGQAGDLPEGLRFVWDATGGYEGTDRVWNEETEQWEASPPGGCMSAYIGNNFVGHISLFPEGEIAFAEVEPQWQRRGIATALTQELDRRGIPWYHSDDLSQSGGDWVDNHPDKNHIPNRFAIWEAA